MSRKYTKFKHIESGNIYELLMITNLTATRDDFVPTAVYRDVRNGSLWSRPFLEFREKFEELKEQ